jgi:hypothetical protein
MALVNLDAILSPEGTSHAKQHRLAPRRFKSLDGVRLGLLGNSKLNADSVLLAVGDLLKEKYAIQSVVIRSKPSFSKPAEEALVQEIIDNADVVLTGVGD